MTLARPDGPQRAAIAGIGETRYTKWGGMTDRNEFQLAVEAIGVAARDAGIRLDEIDGLACFADTSIDSSLLALALGIDDLRLCASVWGGRGGGPMGALALAVDAVETGRARHVAVFRSLCQGQTRRYGKFYPARMHADMVSPFGLFSAGQGLAMLIQRYRHEYGFTDAQQAMIPLMFRANAQRNPRALMRGRPLTMEDYLNSRRIVDPLRVHDCCLETDGACAVIVTTRERARDLRKKPVRVLAAALGTAPGWSTGAMGAHNMPEDIFASGGQAEVARQVFGMAGVAPEDIDTAQFYDHFGPMIFMSLEDFGFCKRGEGPAWIESGQGAWPTGGMPLNTHGGSLSEAYVHGFNHLLEGVRQLRGESTSQVESAELCLVSGGSVIMPTTAAILGV